MKFYMEFVYLSQSEFEHYLEHIGGILIKISKRARRVVKTINIGDNAVNIQLLRLYSANQFLKVCGEGVARTKYIELFLLNNSKVQIDIVLPNADDNNFSTKGYAIQAFLQRGRQPYRFNRYIKATTAGDLFCIPIKGLRGTV